MLFGFQVESASAPPEAPADTCTGTAGEGVLIDRPLGGQRSGFRAAFREAVFAPAALGANANSQALPRRPTQSASPAGGTH